MNVRALARGFVGVGLLAAGCGLAPYSLESASGGSVSGGGTLGESATGAPTTGMVEETGTSSTGGMVEETGSGSSTGPGPGEACDPIEQDCPDGYKCAAYAEEGSSGWFETKCVPVIGDGVDGELCIAEGSTGVDSCAKGHMCWNVDQETGFGTCVAQCSGTWRQPVCADPWAACTIAAEGALTLCFPTCSPLLHMCEVGEACIHSPTGNFVCVPDASGDAGQVFDPCEFWNACDPGLMCANPWLAVECDPMAPGCCLPFCEIGSDGCPGMGQECLPWYMPGEAPPMLENVGVCGLPQ